MPDDLLEPLTPRIAKTVLLWVVILGLGLVPALVAQWNFNAGALLTLAVFVGVILFVVRPRFRRKPKTPEDTRDWPTIKRELEEAGLIETTDYHARRAFEVGAAEDEGSCYYIELEDGRVLLMFGQYLYHYEFGLDDDAAYDDDQPRTFPTSEFSILRHKTDGHVLELIVGGSVLEPEWTAPPFSEYGTPEMPRDGTIYPAGSYDRLKAERWRKGVRREGA